MDRRVDVSAGVHVRAHQHGALTVAMVRRDVRHLDRLELRPGRHPIAPRLGQVDELHVFLFIAQYGKLATRPSWSTTFLTIVRSVTSSNFRSFVILPKSFSLLIVPSIFAFSRPSFCGQALAFTRRSNVSATTSAASLVCVTPRSMIF